MTVDAPYLLVLFSVPYYVGTDGGRYIDPLWAKDLVEHARYLPKLTVAAPLSSLQPPENAVCIDSVPELRGIGRVELPQARRALSLGAHLVTAWRLWGALSNTAIVHTSVAGGPLPEAWFLLPMLRLRRRFLIIVVESAFWRLEPGETPTAKRRLRSAVSEWLNRICVERANLSFFTQQDYMRTLLRKNKARGFLNEATWIDDEQVIGEDRLSACIQERRERVPLSLVFAARLVPSKGVVPLIQAVIELLEDGLNLTLDVYGEGPCREQCEHLVMNARVSRSIRIHGSVPYGTQFFDALRSHDLLVVPNVTDEQPRIVYDAYSQGLPVLAADTAGLRQCVTQGETGTFFSVTDWSAMKASIAAHAVNRECLPPMARAAVKRARLKTHRHMHSERSARIVSAFDEWHAGQRPGAHSPSS